jgi:hypothetical protein
MFFRKLTVTNIFHLLIYKQKQVVINLEIIRIDMKLIGYCILFFSLSSLADNNIEHLNVNEGYAILPLVISGTIPETITIEGSAVFAESYTVKRLKAGNNYELIVLPAGEYKWTKIRVNKSYYFDLEDHEFILTVRKNNINYGGHLIIDINSQFGTAKYNYVNRSSQIIKELEDCCNTIMPKYPLIFTGDSEDPFIDFYRNAVSEGSN